MDNLISCNKIIFWLQHLFIIVLTIIFRIAEKKFFSNSASFYFYSVWSCFLYTLRSDVLVSVLFTGKTIVFPSCNFAELKLTTNTFITHLDNSKEFVTLLFPFLLLGHRIIFVDLDSRKNKFHRCFADSMCLKTLQD